MKTKNALIGVQQILAICLLGALTPTTRSMVTFCAGASGRAAWLAPIIGSAYAAIILLCLAALFKKDNPARPMGLGERFEHAFGKLIGKTISVVYFFWISFYFFAQTRYYAERMISTIFPDTQIQFFIAAMMMLVFIAIRGGIESFGRFSEGVILLFVILIVILFALLLPSVKLSRVLPVIPEDIVPSIKGSLGAISIYASITYFFFIGDSVSGKEALMKKGIKAVVFLAVMPTLIVFFATASLGDKLVKSLSLPIFSTMKIITFIQPFDRLEAVMLSAWVVADFVLIGGLGLSLAHLLKRIFNLSKTKYLAAPISLMGFTGGIFVSPTLFKLSEFTDHTLMIVISAVFAIFIPLAALITEKIRMRVIKT